MEFPMECFESGKEGKVVSKVAPFGHTFDTSEPLTACVFLHCRPRFLGGGWESTNTDPITLAFALNRLEIYRPPTPPSPHATLQQDQVTLKMKMREEVSGVLLQEKCDQVGMD